MIWQIRPGANGGVGGGKEAGRGRK